MNENWKEFWKKDTALTRIVDFMRVHYFANIPIKYLGDVKDKEILEAGCGHCETLLRIANKAKKVTGIDISKRALLKAESSFEEKDIPKNKYSLILGNIPYK